eukprot:gene6090-1090_t
MLKFNSTLVSITLERNKFSRISVEALCQVLVPNSTLQALNLGWNRVCTPGAESLAALLCDNPALTSLNLYQCDIRAKGGAALARALRQHPALRTLNLATNRLGTSVSDIAAVLRDCVSLRELNLMNNMCTQAEGAALAAGLKDNLGLMCMNLSSNRFGNEAVAAILASMAGKTPLCYIDLSETGCDGSVVADNHIGPEGIRQLAGRMERKIALHTLHACYARIGHVGGVALSIALADKVQFKSLKLSGNHMGGGAVLRLCASLSGLSSLTELDLAENDIGLESLPALCQVVLSNPGLLGIGLRGNHPSLEPHLDFGTLSAGRAADILQDPKVEKDAALPRMGVKRLDYTPQRGPVLEAPRPVFEPSTNFLPSLGGSPLAKEVAVSHLVQELQPPRPYSPNVTVTQEIIPTSPRPERPAPLQTMSSPASAPHPAAPTPIKHDQLVQSVPTTALNVDRTRGSTMSMAPWYERQAGISCGGMMLSDDKLRKEFDKLDPDHAGYVDSEAYYTSFDDFGVSMNPKQMDELL